MAEFGLPFAAKAVAELSTLVVETDWQGSHTVNPRIRRPPGRPEVTAHRPAADRVRSLLAVCDDDTHRAVVEALSPCRSDLPRRIVTCYLVPSETDWAEQCLESEAWLTSTEWSLLLCSLSSAEPLRQLKTVPDVGWSGWSTELIATVAEGLGGGAAPLLLLALDRTRARTGARHRGRHARRPSRAAGGDGVARQAPG
ncbi:hypothetical protein [Kitasatospora sp. McL0602]|uniref:hypothetical protein n=1 Tax=Kitasatospora sp. McL0602 TaxID=3439530 RepID=UPI003F8C856E